MIKKQRKKIVIIGNGFDLANDLKTSYKDFINWIYYKTFQEVYFKFKNDRFEFQKTLTYNFFQITINNFSSFCSSYNKIVDCNSEVFEIIKTIDSYDSLEICKSQILTHIKKYGLKQNINNLGSLFKIEIKNIILNEILETYNTTKNWSDIEYTYLKLLLKVEAKKLNEDFNKIKKSLIEYLKTESKKEIKIRDDYRRFFNTVNNDDLILNFNYTNTFDTYLKSIKCNIINIHGTLNDKLEDVIFGYGNYNFEQYEMIEESNDNEKLEFFKIFQYLNNKAYSELMEYITEEDYEIVIIGHSCGLSDKSLLKKVFENELCKKITLFYHQWQNNETKNIEDNFKELTKNISRYFSDKSRMLDIVENKIDSYNNDF